MAQKIEMEGLLKTLEATDLSEFKEKFADWFIRNYEITKEAKTTRGKTQYVSIQGAGTIAHKLSKEIDVLTSSIWEAFNKSDKSKEAKSKLFEDSRPWWKKFIQSVFRLNKGIAGELGSLLKRGEKERTKTARSSSNSILMRELKQRESDVQEIEKLQASVAEYERKRGILERREATDPVEKVGIRAQIDAINKTMIPPLTKRVEEIKKRLKHISTTIVDGNGLITPAFTDKMSPAESNASHNAIYSMVSKLTEEKARQEREIERLKRENEELKTSLTRSPGAREISPTSTAASTVGISPRSSSDSLSRQTTPRNILSQSSSIRSEESERNRSQWSGGQARASRASVPSRSGPNMFSSPTRLEGDHAALGGAAAAGSAGRSMSAQSSTGARSWAEKVTHSREEVEKGVATPSSEPTGTPDHGAHAKRRESELNKYGNPMGTGRRGRR